MEFGNRSASKPCRIFLAAADSKVEFRDDDVELNLLREGLSVLIDAEAEILFNSQNACITLKLANRTPVWSRPVQPCAPTQCDPCHFSPRRL